MSSFQSSILYALILALVGYFVLPMVTSGLDPAVTFAAGLALGGIFIAIISNSTSAEPKKVQTTDEKVQTEQSPTKTIYVGNLPYRANEAVVKELFEKYGEVLSVRLLKDRQTGKRRGFGFVEMDDASGDKAIKALNDSEFQQRTLKVREAKDRPEDKQSNELQTES